MSTKTTANELQGLQRRHDAIKQRLLAIRTNMADLQRENDQLEAEELEVEEWIRGAENKLIAETASQ